MFILGKKEKSKKKNEQKFKISHYLHYSILTIANYLYSFVSDTYFFFIGSFHKYCFDTFLSLINTIWISSLSLNVSWIII